ncbi:zinc-binding dehydrogenase [Salirhabdus sp. Marseille-P4669]|uniref:zinc-binding dehydrogenase n=1 Tax=Salirhabdus sp. Marseille-P4669 TaxID=2042310 RepID=UPI000C79CDE2|nr:zinc-binding dehydrogenase [Salirhabdus sp. Marseille-P4669]
MKAIVHEGTGLEGLSYRDFEEPTVAPHMVKVKVKAAGMNRRDLIVTKLHQESSPLIMGCEGAGIIEEVGEGVSDFAVGDEVLISASMGWKEKSDAPPETFKILCNPDHGTYAEYIVVPADMLEKKPAFLSWEEAGVLPLAGLTAYRALFTRGQVKPGDTIMLPGIGSGVLTFILKFAKAVGARVIVTSRHEDKLKRALDLGADVAIPTESDWTEELKNESVDILFESIGRATMTKSLGIIRKGGTVVTFGATTEDQVNIDIRQFFYGQYNLLGTTLGSHEEFKEMVAFVEKHQIHPMLDRSFSLSEYKEAFEYLRDSKNFGKLAFKVD